MNVSGHGWMRVKYICTILHEQEFERNYPSRRGPPSNMIEYMKGDKNNIVPIMTNSESILQFEKCLWKPATALNILRETVMEENCLIMHLRPTVKDGI